MNPLTDAAPTRAALSRQLWAGVSRNALARRYGMPKWAMHNLLARLGLEGTPAGHVALPDLARELGLGSPTPLRRHPQVRRYGQRNVIAERDVPELLASAQGHRLPHQAADWLTSQRAAELLAVTTEHFLRSRRNPNHRFASIRAARVWGLSGNVWRYHPDDVQRLARSVPIAPAGRVRGRMDVRTFRAITGAGRTTASEWCCAGMPAIRNRSGRWLIDPQGAVSWLEQSPTRRAEPVRLRADARLRAHLEAHRAA